MKRKRHIDKKKDVDRNNHITCVDEEARSDDWMICPFKTTTQ